MGRKSELKENILATKVETAIKWGLQNRIPVLAGLGMILFGVLASSVFIIRRNQLRELNWGLLAQAEDLLRQKKFDQSRQILASIKISSPNTTEATFSSYYIGEIELAEKNLEDAIENFSDVITHSGENPIKPLALSNLGYAFESKGDFLGAVESYQAFMGEFSDHFMAPRIQLALGRSLAQSGDNELAKESLGQLIDLYPTSVWAENARRILDKIESR